MSIEFEEVSTDKEFKSLSLSEVIDYITDSDITWEPAAFCNWVGGAWPPGTYGSADQSTKATKIDSCTPSGMETLSDKYKDLIVNPEVKTLIYETIAPMLKKMNKVCQPKTIGDFSYHEWILGWYEPTLLGVEWLQYL